MSSGPASPETDIGPWLSFSIIARRLGSPSAWKTRSMSGFFLSANRNLRRQPLQYLPPSLFTHLRPIGPFKKGSLMGTDQVGPFVRRQELHCHQGHRDAPLTDAHGRGKHGPAVGHNVLIDGVVDAHHASDRR